MLTPSNMDFVLRGMISFSMVGYLSVVALFLVKNRDCVLIA